MNSFTTEIENRIFVGEPALEISQLAVDKRYERQNIGRTRIGKIIAIACEINEQFSGIKYIVLCSVKSAEEFYQRVNFKYIEHNAYVPRDGRNNPCTPMIMRLNYETKL